MIEVVRDTSQKMMPTVPVRQRLLRVDAPAAHGDEDLGVTPHELYDSALGVKGFTTCARSSRSADR